MKAATNASEVFMLGTANRTRRLLVVFALVFSVAPVLPAEPPAILVGLDGLGGSSSASVEPSAAARLNGSFSWRGAWAEDGYVAFDATASAAWLFTDPAGLHDEEGLNLEVRLPSPFRALTFSAGLGGSMTGSLGGGSPHFSPSWSAAWLCWDDGEASGLTLNAPGTYLGVPDGDTDLFYQGLRLDLDVSPSIRTEYGATLEAGYENEPELARSAWRGFLVASLGGLAGYFFDWSASLQGGGRLSTEAAETSVYGDLRLDARWSPSQAWSFTASAFARPELSVYRETDAGERVRSLALGVQIGGDWSPADHVFVTAGASAARRFSNDDLDEYWDVQASAGIQFAF